MGNRWKILLVDDEKILHDALKFSLSGISYKEKGVLVLSAFSEVEAKEILKKHNDIVVAIIDLSMERVESGYKIPADLDIDKYVILSLAENNKLFKV